MNAPADWKEVAAAKNEVVVTAIDSNNKQQILKDRREINHGLQGQRRGG